MGDPGTIDSVVEAHDLELAYGRHTALCCADFAIPPAALTVLMGSNGSGKSTLMNAIAGLVEPLRGSLVVLDKPPPPDPGSVAYVLQATAADALLPITVREIVTMARFAHRGLLGRLQRSDREAVERALATMELQQVVNCRFSELSGGQRQRALVAQGLAQEAEILLLDEPMTGLDLVSRARIIDVLSAQREEGRAVIMASHDLDDAMLADHVLLLAGRVVSEGPPAIALAPDRLREAYGHRYLELDDAVGILDDHHHHGHGAHSETR